MPMSEMQGSSSRFSGRYSVSLGSFLKSLLRTRAGALAMGLLERTPLRTRLYSTSIHPTRGVFVGSGSMAEDWDRRARESARFYIATDDWESEEKFERSGEREVDAYILKDLALSSESRVLEIGCGVGRLLRPMARRFAEIHGVDISEEMISRGRERLGDLAHVHLQQTDGSLPAFRDGTFDWLLMAGLSARTPQRVRAEVLPGSGASAQARRALPVRCREGRRRSPPSGRGWDLVRRCLLGGGAQEGARGVRSGAARGPTRGPQRKASILGKLDRHRPALE